jgi:hypothetical protein
MSTTEDRLRDYLGAVADSVRADNTRPLTAPAAPPPGPRPGPFPDRRHGWRGWAVPLAAAASVLAIVSVSLALTGPATGQRPAAPRPTAAGPATAGAPGYFAETYTESGTVVGAEVRSTASGAVIARIPSPGQSGILNLAAAPDDRTFYGAFGTSPPGQYVANKVTIDSFGVSGGGKVTGPAAIAGGVLTFSPQLYPNIDALAVSPDGGQLAVLVNSLPTPQARAMTTEIVLIDLRTGVRRVWRGGLNRAGFVLGVQSLSWAHNGRSLDFLASWCAQQGSDGACSAYQSDATSTSQVRSLNLRAGGGSLDASTAVLSEPFYAQSLVAVAAGQFDLLVPSADKKANTQPGAITVGQYSAATGKLERVLYRLGRPGDGLSILATLTSDPSGRFLLLHLGMGHGRARFAGVGWIDHGAFRTLDTSQWAVPSVTGW